MAPSPSETRTTLSLTPFEVASLSLCGTIVVSNFIYTLLVFPDLPATVAVHFDLSGEADGWGSKEWLWLIPILSILIWAGLGILIRYPHLFNYPVPITDDNRERQYRLARGIVLLLNLQCVAFLAFLNLQSIEIAQRGSDGLPAWLTGAFLACVFGTIGIYLWRATKTTSA